MSFQIIAILVTLAGLVVSFTLKGPRARTVRKWYVIALCLALGGCLGSFSWLDAETSGRGNWATAFNPFIFAGMFMVGSVMLFVNSIRVFQFKRDQRLDDEIAAREGRAIDTGDADFARGNKAQDDDLDSRDF